MRIACVFVPHFCVQVKKLKNHRLKNALLVIGGGPHEKGLVVDYSAELEGRGLSLSAPLREAYRLAPEALFFPFDKDDYEDFHRELLSLLASFSLRVEPDGYGTAYLDITKSTRMLGSEPVAASRMRRQIFRELGLAARIGVGNSRFLSRTAACHGGSCEHIVPPGRERDFLDPLGSGLLPVPGEVKERLNLFGLNRLGKVAALSLDALAAQFGPLGRDMWGWVNGVEERRRIPLRRTVTYVKKEMVLDVPVDTMEQIRGPLAYLVDELAGEMEQIGMACRKVKVSFSLQNGHYCERDFVFHLPVVRGKEILDRLVRGMHGAVVEAPIAFIGLYALDLSPPVLVQGGLFRAKEQHAEALNTIRGYLAAKYREMPVMKVREDSGAALLPERRFVFDEL